MHPFPIFNDEGATTLADFGLIRSGEYYLKTHNGDILSIYIFTSKSVELGAEELFLFIKDTTSEQRQKRIDSFKQLFSIISQYSSRIAHEIRNPLGIITMNLQFLQQTGQDKNNTEIKFALKGGDRINHFLEELTTLSNLSDCSKTDEDVNGLILEAIQAVFQHLKEKQQKFDTHLDEDLPTVKINSKQIRQVFINILTAVINYSDENSTITITSGILEPPFHKSDSEEPGIFVVVKNSISVVSIEEFKSNFVLNAKAFIKSAEITQSFTEDLLYCNDARMKVEKAPDGSLITRIIFS